MLEVLRHIGIPGGRMDCLALLDGKEFLETKDRKLWIDLKMCPGKFMCWRLVPQHLAILGGGRNFKGGSC